MKALEALHITEEGIALVPMATLEVPSGAVLTAPLYVGICGTDLQILRRQRTDPATILGHEGIARVITAPVRSAYPAGSLVVFNPVDVIHPDRILGHTLPGLLQGRFLVSPEALAGQQLLAFPENLDPLLGPLTEPLGTVIYGHNLVSGVAAQQCIAIIGCGPIGILHLLYAKVRGYRKVLLISRSLNRLEWCLQRKLVTANEVFVDSDNVTAQILLETGGIGVDAAYLCTNRPGTLMGLRRALDYVRPNGVVDLVGGIQDGDRIPQLPQIPDLNAIRKANHCGFPSPGAVVVSLTNTGKRIFITGHRGTSRAHLEAAIDCFPVYGDLFRKVITHIVSQEAALLLFRDFVRGPVTALHGERYLKAVVDMQLAGNTVIPLSGGRQKDAVL